MLTSLGLTGQLLAIVLGAVIVGLLSIWLPSGRQLLFGLVQSSVAPAEKLLGFLSPAKPESVRNIGDERT